MGPRKLLQVLATLGALAGGSWLRAAGKEAWVEVKSPHFVAYSDAGEVEARKALKGFEAIRSVFQEVLPGIRVDPPKPMILLVVRNEASMKRFLPRDFEGKDASRPAGYFLPSADRDYALLRLDVGHHADQPYFVLFHEYTHGIVHLNFPALPVWLDEGLADFYGATEITSDQVGLGQVPAGRLARLRRGPLLPLETLLTVNHRSPEYQERDKFGMFYAQSWAFVHYLFMDEQAKKADLFQAYLKALPAAADPLAAARDGFGDLGKLQDTLARYARRPTYGHWDLPLRIKLTDRDFLTRVLNEAEGLLVRAEFLQQARRGREAQALLDAACTLAPGHPAVWTALGYGYLLRGERDKARAAFETSLQLGSQDFRTPYYLAKLAQDSPEPDRESPAQILAWLGAARALRPDFPGVHMALCLQYSLEPRDASGAIQEGLAAVELEPQALSHRANLGVAYMNLDRVEEAKTIGEQLPQLAVSRGDRRMAASYAESLARFLEARAAQIAVDRQAGQRASGTGKATPLKFSLPAHMAPLGTKVTELVSEGRISEALRSVEKALAEARTTYDRKVLRALRDDLKGRVVQE